THTGITNAAQQAAVADPPLANDMFLRLGRARLRLNLFFSEEHQRTTCGDAPVCSMRVDERIARQWRSCFRRTGYYHFERYPTIELFIVGVDHFNQHISRRACTYRHLDVLFNYDRSRKGFSAVRIFVPKLILSLGAK